MQRDKNYKNPLTFSRVIITNVLLPFFTVHTVYLSAFFISVPSTKISISIVFILIALFCKNAQNTMKFNFTWDHSVISLSSAVSAALHFDKITLFPISYCPVAYFSLFDKILMYTGHFVWLTFPDDLTPLMMQAYTKIHASRRHTARCHCTSPMLPMFVSSVAPRTTYLQCTCYNTIHKHATCTTITQLTSDTC